MIEFDAVNGRRVTVRSAARAGAPHGLAKLLPSGVAGGLSTEVLAVAYGPAESLRTFVEVSGLRELERAPIATGTCVLYAVPSEKIAESGLPAETRMGMLELGSTIAHGYFYRPFNRMADVVDYFEALGLREGLGAATVPAGRFQVTYESYATTVPDLGLVSIGRPSGVPASLASRRRVGSGNMWVDRVPDRLSQVVYEDRAVRLSFRPAPSAGALDGSDTQVSAGFERSVLDFTRGLTTTRWS
jgi:hypothetical protein